MAIYDLGTASLAANGEVTGVGTTWKAPLTLIRVGATIVFKTEPVQIYTISEIISDTQINVYNPNSETVPAGTGYAILAHDGITVQGLAQDVAETLRYYQSRESEVSTAVDIFKDFDQDKFSSDVNQVNTQYGQIVTIGAQVSYDAAQVSTDKDAAAASAASAAYDKDAAAASAQEAADYAASLDTQNLLRKDLSLSDLTDKPLARSNLDVYSKSDSDRLRGYISLFDFGAIGDGVNHPLSERFNSLAEAQAVYPFVSSLSQSIDYAAIQMGVNTAIQSKRKLIIPGGSFYSSDPIEIKVENHYSKTGLDMSGQGRAASTIIFPKDSDGFKILPVTPGEYTYNVVLSDFDIIQDEFDGSTVGLGGIGIRATNGCSQMFWTNLRIQGFGTMVKFDDAVFLSRFVGLHSSLCGNGFIMGSMGTTNFIDNIFVYGSIGTAYKITCVYSSIGSLACDRCSGVPYDFVDYSGSVGSIGWESAKADTAGPIVRFTRSKAAVGTIYGFDLESSPSFSSYFSFGESEIDISKVNFESEGGVSKSLTSKFYVMFRSKVSIGSVTSNYTFTFVEPSIDSDLNSSYIELDGIKQSHGGVRPYIGDFGDSSRAIAQPGKDYTRPAFIFDCYGGFTRAGAVGQKDLYYVQGPKLGMWGIERRPDVHGTAAYVSLTDAEYNGTAQYAVVPAILYGVGRPENPVTGTHWSDPNSKKVFYYAYGQWQDYMGNVLP